MLEVYNKDRQKLAILENAFNVEETSRINAINYFKFSLPDTDPKNEYCQRFHLIRYNDGEFYRIINDGSEETETGRNDYECEHVIALLIDTVMPDFVNIGGLGYYTEQVLQFILNRQHKKDWILYECDFRHQYEYAWEKENLLSALFSVPNRFTAEYIWVSDTSLYPYRISLKKLNESRNPDHYIRKGHNRLKPIRQSDSRNICTRIYPFGAGEGVNQLTIANVNNGVRYLQSPQEYIDKYGLIERVWTDRRYIDEQSLLEAARVMLNELQEPYVEYGTQMIGNPKVGDIVQIVGGIKSFVVETSVAYEEVPQTMIKIANRPKDIASTVADLADRQRIEATYSQGATQIYADSKDSNADSENPVELRFYVPEEMIKINSIQCKIRLSRYRGELAPIISGGEIKTSKDGGSSPTISKTIDKTNPTSKDGGSSPTISKTIDKTNPTSKDGGSSPTISKTIDKTNPTTSADDLTTTEVPREDLGPFKTSDEMKSINGINHHHLYDMPNHKHDVNSHTHNFTIPGHDHTVTIADHTHNFTIPGHDHTVTIADHTHNFTIPGHDHTVTIADHTHNFTIPGHDHTVTIADHTHNFTIPGHDHTVTIADHTHTIDNLHTHDMTPKISFHGNPTSFWLIINGVKQKFFESRDAELNITQFFVDEIEKKIKRGVWHTITIQPNDLARVEISYNIQGYIQSRGEMTV